MPTSGTAQNRSRKQKDYGVILVELLAAALLDLVLEYPCLLDDDCDQPRIHHDRPISEGSHNEQCGRLGPYQKRTGARAISKSHEIKVAHC